MPNPDAIILGAGPAGLAVAAELRRAGRSIVLLEKADSVGSVWRRHYDRLHLHTPKSESALPGLPMPAAYPRYPSREQVVAYLEGYARTFALNPELGVEAEVVRRDGELWRVDAGARSWRARNVVVATGWTNFPNLPSWPGQENFGGQVLHSTLYHNPEPYRGKRALVVGFGNSGGEIALDLAEAGVDVTISVRSPVRIIPRDLLGLPITTWAILQRRTPPWLSDALNAPILRLVIGSIESLGLKRAAKGPRRMVLEDGQVPLIDVGTVAKIRSGAIKVRGGISRFEADGVVFEDGRAEKFEAVVLATGFRPDLSRLLPDARSALDASGRPTVSGAAVSEPGLFFCGARTVPTGQLREIALEAPRIAAALI